MIWGLHSIIYCRKSWIFQLGFVMLTLHGKKAGIENANGWRRRELPRKTDLDKLTHQDLNDTIQAYNLTPRKCLNFKTPLQAILQEQDIHVNITFNNNVALQI